MLQLQKPPIAFAHTAHRNGINYTTLHQTAYTIPSHPTRISIQLFVSQGMRCLPYEAELRQHDLDACGAVLLHERLTSAYWTELRILFSTKSRQTDVCT